MEKPLLSILISTINERIESLTRVLLPHDERVHYIVSWQLTKEMEPRWLGTLVFSDRKDVSIEVSHGAGLAASRNKALSMCETPFALIADDDVVYSPNAITTILKAFDDHKEADVLCFQAEDRQGNLLQPYPKSETDYKDWPRGYSASSVEIALRLRYDTPRFDTRFGQGSSDLVCGEEEVFLHECAVRGHSIRFVPKTILQTDGQTTSKRLSRHPKFMLTKGATLRMVCGRTGAWMRTIKYALQAPYGEKTWTFRLLAQGIRYIQQTPTRRPLISVIIPYYNRAATLPRLFASLVDIEYSPLEIILVDNGSDDGSLRLCEAFRKEKEYRFARIGILTEPVRSAAAARNRGLLSAQGEYVYFFDSDDELSPTFFKEATPYMDRYDLICARTRMVFENGKTKARRRVVPTTHAAQILGCIISTQTSLIRRTLFTQHPATRMWNTGLTRWDDLEWGLRLLYAARSVKWLNTVHHRIYRHADSLSGKNHWEDREAIFTALNAIGKDLLEVEEQIVHQRQQKAWNALAARTLLVTHKMKQTRDAHDGFTEIQQKSIDSCAKLATPRFQRIAKTLLRLWPKKLYGLWRVLLAFV